MLHSVGTGHELLGFLDRPLGIVEGIHFGENRHVHVIHVPSGEFPQAGVDPPSVLVPRRMKRNHAVVGVVQ